MAATIPEAVRADMLKHDPARTGFGTAAGGGECRALPLLAAFAGYVTGQTLEVNGGWRG
jgi:3-oxoacyl-[acyl-carrier protein] reductase